ncbi:TetR family transcriptional regulator [Cribrihabitans sp. XS_ASV171]
MLPALIETAPASERLLSPAERARVEKQIKASVFHLPSILERRAREARGLPKRQRTRHKLIAATASQMEVNGYDGLTIEAIIEAAEIARGTFYLHFQNRSEAALAVQRAFIAMMRRRRPRGGSRMAAFDAIYFMNVFYIKCYKANAPLLAGQEALMHERPELSISRDYRNHKWALLILRDLARRTGLGYSEALTPEMIFGVRATVGMADETLREIFVHRSPKFSELIADDLEMARVLSVLWFRSLYGRNPEL